MAAPSGMYKSGLLGTAHELVKLRNRPSDTCHCEASCFLAAVGRSGQRDTSRQTWAVSCTLCGAFAPHGPGPGSVYERASAQAARYVSHCVLPMHYLRMTTPRFFLCRCAWWCLRLLCMRSFSSSSRSESLPATREPRSATAEGGRWRGGAQGPAADSGRHEESGTTAAKCDSNVHRIGLGSTVTARRASKTSGHDWKGAWTERKGAWPACLIRTLIRHAGRPSPPPRSWT